MLISQTDLASIPHNGYHWQGQTPFFEGWYVRLLLPETRESFAFMYSIENPGGTDGYRGGALQILGSQYQKNSLGDFHYWDHLSCRTFPDVQTFWAAPRSLQLGQWGKRVSNDGGLVVKPQPLSHSDCWQTLEEGYQIYQDCHQGRIQFPDSPHLCQWQFTVTPETAWGGRNRPGRATAGWLSFLPLFDPGWQVLLPKGIAQGYIDWYGKRCEFDRGLVYIEKNWGMAFPRAWFWLQANDFPDHSSLSITAAGGTRRVLDDLETVAIIGIHWHDRLYEFASLHHELTWQVTPWGRWYLRGQTDHHWVEVTGTTAEPGSWVHTPTAQGLQLNCRDTTRGKFRITMGQRGQAEWFTAESMTAGLELGGDWAE